MILVQRQQPREQPLVDEALGPVREVHTMLAAHPDYFEFTELWITEPHANDALLDAFKTAHVYETAAEVASKYCYI